MEYDDGRARGAWLLIACGVVEVAILIAIL